MTRLLTHDDLEALRDDDLLTVAEAAAALDVTTRLLRRWLRDGRVPWVLVGQAVMVPLSVAAEYERATRHDVARRGGRPRGPAGPPRHGTYARYKTGCRCLPCRRGYADYRRHERARRRAEQGHEN